MWQRPSIILQLVVYSFVLVTSEPINRSTWKIQNRRSSQVPKEICMTPECVTAAASLIEAMDLTADPCVDFFQFACGGWVDKHPMPESRSLWSNFDILDQEITTRLKRILAKPNTATDIQAVNNTRDMYAACLDTDTLETIGVEPLADFLGQFGHWPMTIDNWNENDFDWINVATSVRLIFRSTFLLYVYNDVDTNNTQQNSIYIDQAPLGMARSVLVNADLNNLTAVMQAYKNYIIGTAKVIRTYLGSSVSDSQIEQDALDLLAFEIELAKITTPEEDRRNNTRLYNPMPIASLQDWTDQVPVTNNYAKIVWLDYLNRIYRDAVGELTNDERIIVVETEYLKKLVALLDRSSIRVIANYVHWRSVKILGIETNQEMRNLDFEFNKIFLGINAPEPRYLTCIYNAHVYFGQSIGALYVKEAFDEESKLAVEEMISYLKVSFKSLVDEAVWMDDATKLIAKEKADTMKELIGYPDWIKNDTALDNFYNGIQISKTNHFGNIQSISSLLLTKRIGKLREAPDREVWILFPAMVNAAYNVRFNSINFPAGILDIPFFERTRIQAMNYGGIGTIIGHELTHGFDDRGRQSDKDGNIINWWSPETLTNYLQRAQCFIDQYNNYTIPELAGTDTPHLNGENTQGENIADNGAIREAFRAYKNYVAENGPDPLLPGLDQFTPEQIFFISYGNIWCGVETLERMQEEIRSDPHSPLRYRIIVPLSNSEDFAREFNCPVGPMNSADKCILW